MPPQNATIKIHAATDTGKTIAYIKSANFLDIDALMQALIERTEHAAKSEPPE